MKKLTDLFRKIEGWIKDNKFITFIIGLLLFALIGPIFFGKLTGNVVMDSLPDYLQTALNTLLLGGFFYLCTLILFLFGTGVFNMIRENSGKPQLPEEAYHPVKNIAHITGAVVSAVLVYLILFS